MDALATSATAPEARYVEHVMGMPITLAMRGRHARTAERRSRGAEHDRRAVLEQLAPTVDAPDRYDRNHYRDRPFGC